MNFIKKHKWPLTIFVAAFLIRLIYLIQSRSNPTFYYPMVDELWNLNWAKEITGGNFWGDEAYFRGPLYPYMLALFLKIGAGSIFVARLFQTFVAAGSAVLVFLIGSRLLNRTVGIIAALAYALYGTLMFYEAMLLIPVIFLFLNLLCIYLMLLFKEQYDLKKWLTAGFILGLAAIARPNILLIAPFFLIWIYFGFKEIKTLKKRLLIPAVYFIGILIPVFSVTLRNYIVTDEFILISSQGGVNFYIGNNPETEGLTMLMPEIDLDESLPWTEFTEATREAAEQEAGHPLTAGEESSFWTKKTLRFIGGNPLTFVSITFKKLVYFLVGFENSDQTDIYQARTFSGLYSLLLWKNVIYFPFGFILPLAAVGAVALWPKRKELAVLYIFIIGYIPTVILFLVTARHRLPVIPFMLIFAAAGVLAICEFFRKNSWKKLLKYGALLLVLLISANRTYFEIGFENIFQTHFNLGLTYTRQGDLESAEKEYKEALNYNPYSTTGLNNLGNILYQLGKMDEALEYFNRAIDVDPKFADAYNNIGLIYESRNDLVRAEQFYNRAIAIDPGLFQAYINLGDIALARNDFARSEREYKRAGEKAPNDAAPYFKLGALYARWQRFAEAEQKFVDGSRLGTPRAVDYLNWGNIYYSTRQPARAIELYHKSIAADSTFTQSYYNLALLFNGYGYPADSTQKYLNKILQIDPNFSPARQMLQKLIK